MRRLATAFVWVAALAAVDGFGAGAAVFGSFASPTLAEALRQRVAAEVAPDARTVRVAVNGATSIRVIAGEGDSPSAIRALIERGKAAGYADAWFWAAAPSVGSEPAPSRVAAASKTALATSGPIALPSTAPPRRTEAPAAATLPVGGPAAPLVAEIGPTRPIGVGDSLRLVADSGDGEAIVVPRYDTVEIELDGHLDEAVWREVPGYDNMVVVSPDTLASTRFRTVARYLYTDRGLYVGVWNEQPPDTLIARLSSRDMYINRDGWGITLDTSGEGRYGYWFNINLGGSVLDGKVAPERTFTREWDGPWNSATAQLDDGWSLEAFLPWSMMTMPPGDGERTMGMYTSRKVAYIDEQWGWPALPFTGARFMSALQQMRLPGVQPKQQLALFPYTATTMNNTRGEEIYNAGFDLFWRPSSNLQVTAAARPDFGAVESDDVVVNLTARETYFPEKRLFFMEGSEIFTTSPRSRVFSGSGGSGARRTRYTFFSTPSTLLNTRRIGGAAVGIEVPDDVTVKGHERSLPSTLLGAAKVTGENGPVRYGVLTAFEDDPVLRGERDDGTPVSVHGVGRDFGVARVLYERTGAGRQSIGYLGTLVEHPSVNAAVHGVDAHHLSGNGKWRTDVQGMMSDVDGTAGYGLWTDLQYTQRQGLTHMLEFDYQDRSLDINDLGFLSRNDMIGGRYGLWMSSANLGWLRRLSVNAAVGRYVNDAGQVVQAGAFVGNSFTFHNRDQLRVMVNYFTPQWEDLESRGNGAFKVRPRAMANLSYGTDSSKAFAWSVQVNWMQEEIKDAMRRLSAGFTYKPMDRFSLDFDLTRTDQKAWLLWQGGRDFATYEAAGWQPQLAMDLFLTARQQFRLTMQWAGIRAEEREFWRIPTGEGGRLVQVDEDPSDGSRLNINRLTAQFRYRWEIAPLSDLFVVYTRGSNAFTEDDDPFGDMFNDALTRPIVDLLIVKLRYRFGA